MPNWWNERPLRLVQTNLREIDLKRNPREVVREVKAFKANTILFSVGGIVSFFPSQLEFQTPSPSLSADFVGEAVDEAHTLGLRFVARFDFSKCHRHVYEKHPEWFYLRADGQPQVFNGLYSTCINGGYYRDYAFTILKEALERYDIDGCFFNMFGNHARDYSGIDHGLCCCVNCQRHFRELFGYPLPQGARDDAAAHDYQLFQDISRDEVAGAIGTFIHATRPNTAFFTYTLKHTDIVRSESNSAVGRPLPIWQYSGSDNVKCVLGSCADTAVSNAAVHFVDIPYRFTGVSPHLTALRLAQNLTHGAGLDLYVLGTLQQEDPTGLAAAHEIFAFAAENEEQLTALTSLATTCLIYPERSIGLGMSAVESYRGLFRILTEDHTLFDCAHDFLLDDGPAGRLDKYETLVLPAAACLSDKQCATIDAFVQRGGRLLATGPTALYDERGRLRPTPGLASCGMESVVYTRLNTRSAYFRTDDGREDTSRQPSLVFLDGTYLHATLRPGAVTAMKLVPPSSFGPPEKCFIDAMETDSPGVVRFGFGSGRTTFFPWSPDLLYYRHGTPGHADLILSEIADLAGNQRQLETNAHPLIETALLMGRDGRVALTVVNSSGHQSTSFFAPIPMLDLVFKMRLPGTYGQARSLRGKSDLLLWREGLLTCVRLDRLDLHETIILH